MREKIIAATKVAMKAKNELELSTLRLMSTAIKSKDIDLRGTEGSEDGVSEEVILGVLATMVKQRRDSAESYRKGKRMDLAERELKEIDVITKFLPKQLSEDEVTEAIDAAVVSSGASSIKDMGKVMAELKGQYAGQMDFSEASTRVKAALSAL